MTAHRRRRGSRVPAALAGAVLWASSCGPAAATTERDIAAGLGRPVHVDASTTARGGLLTLCADLTVDGTSSGDAVAIAGDVIVRGRVEGDVVALLGRVRLEGPDALVTGNAFAVLGGIDQAEGSRVEGRRRALASLESGERPGYFRVAYAGPVLVGRLLFLLFWILAALAGAFVAPRTVARAATELRRHALRLLGIGLLLNASLLLTGVLAVALIQVYVGIPLLFLLALAMGCLAAVSFAATFHAIGERIAERLHEHRVSGYLEVLAGAFLFAALHFVPLLGELTFVLACVAGSGAVVAGRSPRPAA